MAAVSRDLIASGLRAALGTYPQAPADPLELKGNDLDDWDRGVVLARECIRRLDLSDLTCTAVALRVAVWLDCDTINLADFGATELEAFDLLRHLIGSVCDTGCPDQHDNDDSDDEEWRDDGQDGIEQTFHDRMVRIDHFRRGGGFCWVSRGDES